MAEASAEAQGWMPAAQPQTARGRRTRNALIQSAREIFEKHGFQDAKIADISALAKLSYGSFYTYFDSKESVFREVVNLATGEMFQATRSGRGAEGVPLDRIREATKGYLLAYSRNARIMQVIEQVSPGDPYFRDLLLDIRSQFTGRIALGIQRLQGEGLADITLDSEITASALGGMVEHFARQWFLFGEVYEEDAALKTLTLIWARGIGLTVPPGP